MIAKLKSTGDLYRVTRRFKGCNSEEVYQLQNESEIRAEYSCDCELLDEDKECIAAIMRIKKELDWMLQLSLLK
jgi:hypothetical protein